MSTSKKRKISGLSGIELELSLVQLKKLRNSIISEEVFGSEEPTPPDSLSDELDKVIALLETRRTNDPLSLSFSAVNEATLDRLNIRQAGLLFLREENLHDAIESTRKLGSAHLWSDENMYKHLSFLSNTYSNKNETSSRMFIDAFFFRTTAMVPSDQRVVVMLEKTLPIARPRKSKLDTVSGVFDYTALVVKAEFARTYVAVPPPLTPRLSENIIAFFVTEAKTSKGIALLEHTPQALAKLVHCAKNLGKDHIRGALTTGERWIFLAVDMDSGGEGATYWQSEVIQTLPASDIRPTSDRYDPALIAGILSSWVTNSFSDFRGDEWFKKGPQLGR